MVRKANFPSFILINSCEHSRLSSLNRSKLAMGMHRVFMHVDPDAKNPGEPLDSDDWTLMIGETQGARPINDTNFNGDLSEVLRNPSETA